MLVYNRQHGWKHTNKSKRKGTRRREATQLGKIEESYLNIAATTYFFDCEKEEAFEKCVKGLVRAFDKNVEKTLACMITTVKMCLWNGLFCTTITNDQSGSCLNITI